MSADTRSLIVVEGIDGAGKSTVAPLVAERLRNANVPAVYRPKSAVEFDDPFVRRQLVGLRDLLWPPPEEEPESDPFGTHFYLYLLAAWYAGLTARHFGVAMHETVIVDGWFYRTIAKAHLRGGLDREWLRTLFTSAAQPRHVFLLDVDPAVVWTRRQKFKPTEVGAWDGMTGDPSGGFVHYQTRVRNELLRQADRERWTIVAQTESSTPAEAVERITGELLALDAR